MNFTARNFHGTGDAESAGRPEAPRSPDARGGRQYPASLAQRRFWVMDKLEPGNPALNVAVRWRIEGDLPAELIEKAFALIVERHEPLRTHFIEIDGDPNQVVRSHLHLRVPSIDLTALAEPEAMAECDRIARDEARAPFDLEIAPLIRVTHVRLRHDLAVVLVTAHHAVCDGWSIGILAREMGAACAAMQAGRRDPALPALPISYGEYAAWQRNVVEEDGLAPEAAYWSQALKGLEFFEMPTDQPRSGAQASPGAIRSTLLDRGLTERLAAVARQSGCTLFMLTYSALIALLHRYTGATDIAVGTQVAGRYQLETENLVGLFTNTLVLRADVAGDQSFSQLLAGARDFIMNALENEALPFEKIVESLAIRRNPQTNSIFAVNFIYQRSFIADTDYGAFRLVDLPSWSAGALHDLNFFMVERPAGWRLSCEFNAELYRQETIDRLLQHFTNILEAVSVDPTQRISAIALLNQRERNRLIAELNQTASEYPRNLSLPQIFARQAAETPDAVAVVSGGQSLSYREIDQRSTALAQRLISLGAGPGARIGVFVSRSADLIITPLAIMKSGGAYVPLDPLFPQARLKQIVEQSGLLAIVGQRGEVPQALRVVPIVPVRSPTDAANAQPLALRRPIDPEDAAYVIFTSGSTGKPKGVQIPHRALTNFLFAMRATPGFTAKDTTLAITTICFDISVLELFLPLTVGATVVIANEEETRDGCMLLSLLSRANVRTMQATPATWELLIEAGWRGDPQLRMLCGGEALSRALADKLLERGPELWNMYGPTETTIWSAARRISRGEGAIPIGGPIANTQFYVVDSHDGLLPQGATGELLIGGDGVATGYLNMPELTRERFADDWFRPASGAKLYRTGDLVRMRPDGDLQYIGRRDHQVKIRGFRIELGEIEAVLSRAPSVRQAIALVEEGAGGVKAIFAYVQLQRSETDRIDEIVEALKREIATALPAYMQPASLVVVDEVPLLPNGKIDRKALSLVRPKPTSAPAPLRPMDEFESNLERIWCEVLGVDSIEQTADFFEMGGHSLLAARLLSRIEASIGYRIGLSVLYKSSSFRAFADHIRLQRPQNLDVRQVLRMGPKHATGNVFAINNTGIFFTLAQRLERLSLTALQLFDPVAKNNQLPGTIEETGRQYMHLIREIQPEGPYALMGWCNGGTLAFETARQLEEAGETVSRVFLVDAWLPGYLARQSWLRAKLASYTYRWRLVMNDWEYVRAGKKSVFDFFADRPTLGRFIRKKRKDAVLEDPAYAAAQAYDQWLLSYTTQMLKAYKPKPLRAGITIIRSSWEPTGRFLSPILGWGGLSREVDLLVVPGDHFSIFSEPGVSVMAKCIEAAVASTKVEALPSRGEAYARDDANEYN